MQIKMIKSEKEYQQALEMLDVIFDAKAGSEQGKELESLVLLIDKYEKENFPIGMPNADEAIKFRIEQMNNREDDIVFKMRTKSPFAVTKREFEYA